MQRLSLQLKRGNDMIKESTFLIMLCAFIVIFCVAIKTKLERNENRDKITNMHQNCLIYHQELPYHKAIATCSEILEGK